MNYDSKSEEVEDFHIDHVANPCTLTVGPLEVHPVPVRKGAVDIVLVDIHRGTHRLDVHHPWAHPLCGVWLIDQAVDLKT